MSNQFYKVVGNKWEDGKLVQEVLYFETLEIAIEDSVQFFDVNSTKLKIYLNDEIVHEIGAETENTSDYV